MGDLREAAVREVFRSWLVNDDAALRRHLAAGVRYSECWGPVYEGRDQVLRWFADWNLRGRVVAWDITALRSAADSFFVEWAFSCVYDGEAGAFHGLSVIDFDAEGRIVSVREFQSKAEAVYPYRVADLS